MKCPHCRESFHDVPTSQNVESDADGSWSITYRNCPACNRLVLELVLKKQYYNEWRVEKRMVVWPRAASRPPCPNVVPKALADD